jgi:hypothetical protein
MLKNVNKLDIPKVFLWGTFYIIFNFLLSLSPLPLFYTLPKTHNNLENISLRELYYRISNLQLFD